MCPLPHPSPRRTAPPAAPVLLGGGRGSDGPALGACGAVGAQLWAALCCGTAGAGRDLLGGVGLCVSAPPALSPAQSAVIY